MKKKYKKPELDVFGDLKKITKGGTPGGEDEDSSFS
mgnify:CR=1 FL=1